MTKMKLKSGDIVYTELPEHEVRTYLFGGSKTGSFNGFLDEAKENPIMIAVHAIVFVYKH